MTPHDGGPAFPQTDAFGRTEEGLSLRDYFAAQAVVALGSHKATVTRGLPWLAEHAYMLADEMLKARSAPDLVDSRDAYIRRGREELLAREER